MPIPLDARVTWGASIPATEPVAGPNERCIELPLAREAMELANPGRVLDAGCALNGYLSHAMEASVVHLTQNTASEKTFVHTTRPLSYVSADLRDLSLFRDRSFDRTVCVSTLEHVGLNNQTYLGPEEACPETMDAAFRELCRVTARTLLVTVPFADPPVGCPEWRFVGLANLHWFCACADAHGYATEVRYYAKTDGGWYGGALEPVPASLDGFPDAVNAIACLRCVR
jgi:hypothetical protein